VFLDSGEIPACIAFFTGYQPFCHLDRSNRSGGRVGGHAGDDVLRLHFWWVQRPDKPEFEDPLQNGELGTELGFAGGVAFGTSLTDRLRAEVELAVHQNDVDEVKLDGFGSFPINADITVVTSITGRR
jgi:hypothetical protein